MDQRTAKHVAPKALGQSTPPDIKVALARSSRMSPNRQSSHWSFLNPWTPLKSMWHHRRLLWQFTVRNVEMRHKGSMLGFVWAVLNPLLLMGVYVFVFRFVFGGSFGVVSDESQWDYGLGVFLSLSLYQLIAETLATSPSLIAAHPNFVKKVVFPLEILPAAAVGAAAVHMLISLAMVLLGVLIVGRGVSMSILLLPLVLVPALLFASGAAWLVAAMGVFFRDIGQVVAAATTALMFASAIFYPATRIQEIAGAWEVLRFNPVVHLVESARALVLWRESVAPSILIGLNLSSLMFATLAFAAFARLKRAFADVI